ncbi:MAG TPA: hypothetical protein VFP72_11095 [Kineosporiaceae bacterium]|nr:hypothetical protein [Kineosporiaceae bacterium]
MSYLLSCPRCPDVSFDPVDSRAEAAVLGNAHDLVWHRGQLTADVVADVAGPVVVAA